MRARAAYKAVVAATAGGAGALRHVARYRNRSRILVSVCCLYEGNMRAMGYGESRRATDEQ